MITLKELCEASQVSRRAIQGYEKAHLISSTGKTEKGYLLYGENSIEEVKLIRLYQDMGFKVSEICELKTMGKEELKAKLLIKKRLLEVDVQRKKSTLIEIERMINNL